MCSLMMISDTLSKHLGAVKSVLKKWFKINDIQLVHLLFVWYLVNLQDARCNNKDTFHRVSVVYCLLQVITNLWTCKKSLFCCQATSVELIVRGFYYRIDGHIAKMFIPVSDVVLQLMAWHSAKCKSADCLIDRHLTTLFLFIKANNWDFCFFYSDVIKSARVEITNGFYICSKTNEKMFFCTIWRRMRECR